MSSVIRNVCAARRVVELAALGRKRAMGMKTMGYLCQAFPPAVAAGLGFWPVRMLCGTTAHTASIGERLIRPDICPLVKTLLGNVIEGNGLHRDVDIWVGLFTCDQMRRGFNTLSEDLGQEVHPIQLPATRTAQAAEYYAEQLGRMVADVESIYGVRFDPIKAVAWHEDYRKAAQVLASAARLGTVSPLDLHAMFHLLFIASPEGLDEFFVRLIASSPEYESSRTVIVTGGPLSLEDTALLDELECRGFGVLPVNCTGLNAVEGMGAMDGGAPDALVHALALEAFRMSACARSRPNTEIYERLASCARSSGAAGIIVKCLKYCDHWYTERERMRKSFDLPVLVFDSDYAGGGRDRQMNRIEAYLEMLR